MIKNLTRYSVLYLFFILLGMAPSGFAPHPETAFQSYLVEKLPPHQEVLAKYIADKYSQPKQLINRIVTAAYKEGARIGVSPLILLAIIEKESSFRPNIINFYGAVGLMQVVPRYHKDKLQSSADQATSALQSPEINLHVGSQILREYLTHKRGDLSAALKKYSGNARQYGERVAQYASNFRAIQQNRPRES